MLSIIRRQLLPHHPGEPDGRLALNGTSIMQMVDPVIGCFLALISKRIAQSRLRISCARHVRLAALEGSHRLTRKSRVRSYMTLSDGGFFELPDDQRL
jgi:hypothetical protein